MSLSTDSKNALDQLRVTARKVLDEQKLLARQVDTRQINTRPVRLISFDIYGTSDQATNLIDLNQDINVSYYDGEVSILTS